MKSIPIKGLADFLEGKVTIIEPNNIKTHGKHGLDSSLDTIEKMMMWKAGKLEEIESGGKKNKFLEREVTVLFEHLEFIRLYIDDQQFLFEKLYQLHNTEILKLVSLVRQLESEIEILNRMKNLDCETIEILTKELSRIHGEREYS